MGHKKNADVIIIGSGIAALTAADRLSDEKNVIIITKSTKENSNSIRAQGGVAAVVSRKDDWMNHFNDTIVAGNEHNDESIVRLLVQKGPSMIHKLIERGMSFDRDHKGKLHLGQEGAHSKRRILHAGGDATGKALINFLLEKVSEKVEIIEHEMVVDLIIHGGNCVGVRTKNISGQTRNLFSDQTVLATGGCGGLYTFTSNDSSITGDGIAMAYRAGAELADLEFVQFHPTLLSVNGEGKGLISEAVRGEGAHLIYESGERLMEGVHPQKDLAPRDVVAREIHHAVLNGEKIFLDISMISNFTMRFPTISEICHKNGINLEKGRIPVVPGAHFLMGGVKVDKYGQTSVKQLFAIGEVACTGVHGANRLASNSLLEGIVFANELAGYILNLPPQHVVPPRNEENIQIKHAPSLPKTIEIRNMMMNNVGIVRSKGGLEKAKKWFEQYQPFVDMLSDSLTIDEMKRLNMLTTGWLITTSALMRTESRGGHYRSDYPEKNDLEWQKEIIVRSVEENTLSLVW